MKSSLTIIYTTFGAQEDAPTAATRLLQTQSLNSFTSTEHESDLLGFEL